MKTTTIARAAIVIVTGIIASASVEARTADLKSVMVGMGVSMDRIHAAIWAGDLPAVSRAADAIANHPRAGGTERLRILAAVGTELGRFKEADGVVHDSAVRLSAVAGRGDMDASLTELATMQAGCVACHSSFRDRLTD